MGLHLISNKQAENIKHVKHITTWWSQILIFKGAHKLHDRLNAIAELINVILAQYSSSGVVLNLI